MLYQAGHIFLVAKRAYERSKEEWSEAMPSIILSTIALECFVNESVERLSHKIFQEPDKAFSVAAHWLEFVESKKGSTLEKIEALHLAFAGTKLDRGSQPFQDLNLLYQLRNELVHRKPEAFGSWDPGDKERQYEPHKFVRELARRGIVPLPSPEMPPVWSQYILNEQTAKWAFNSAVSGVRFAAGAIPPSNLSTVTGLMIDNIEPIS